MKRQNLTLRGPWGRVKSADFGFSYVSGPLISMDPIDPIDLYGSYLSYSLDLGLTGLGARDLGPMDL